MIEQWWDLDNLLLGATKLAHCAPWLRKSLEASRHCPRSCYHPATYLSSYKRKRERRRKENFDGLFFLSAVESAWSAAPLIAAAMPFWKTLSLCLYVYSSLPHLVMTSKRRWHAVAHAHTTRHCHFGFVPPLSTFSLSFSR